MYRKLKILINFVCPFYYLISFVQFNSQTLGAESRVDRGKDFLSPSLTPCEMSMTVINTQMMKLRIREVTITCGRLKDNSGG